MDSNYKLECDKSTEMMTYLAILFAAILVFTLIMIYLKPEEKKVEKYSVCPPSDCTKYRVRKDQLLVKNPFKWPWSGSDFPQFAVSYDEVNKTAEPIFVKRNIWREKPTINCENCRCNL